MYIELHVINVHPWMVLYCPQSIVSSAYVDNHTCVDVLSVIRFSLSTCSTLNTSVRPLIVLPSKIPKPTWDLSIFFTKSQIRSHHRFHLSKLSGGMVLDVCRQDSNAFSAISLYLCIYTVLKPLYCNIYWP
jgi:hypothetical protein